MAGHSHFKNMMHRKGAQDSKRAKIFTKVGKEISVAVKAGGGDPNMNPRLRMALISARSVNMPRDNIEKAIKKALGNSDATNFENITYEGYGPFGVAIIVEVLTDNRNRSAADIRAIFNKYNGSLGVDGSVNFLFDYCGVIKFNQSEVEFDTIFENAVSEGAIDVTTEGEFIVVQTESSNLHKVNQGITEKLKINPVELYFEWIPKTKTELNEEQTEKVLKILSALEDNDDVQNVFSTLDISEELLQKLEQ